MIILAGCCGGMLAVVIGRAAPLRVGNNAVVIRVPSHVILLRKGCHRQRRRHLHARVLVSDLEYLLPRLLALRLGKLPRCKLHRHRDTTHPGKLNGYSNQLGPPVPSTHPSTPVVPALATPSLITAGFADFAFTDGLRVEPFLSAAGIFTAATGLVSAEV